MLDKEYVYEVLGQGGYLRIFDEAIKVALNEWLGVVSTCPTEFGGAKSLDRAVFLNRRINELICERLEGDDEVVIYKRYGSVVITIGDEITLRFKKLNSSLRTMNIKTNRQIKYWSDNERILPGDFEDWINVSYGWQLDRHGVLKKQALIYEYKKMLSWAIEIDQHGIQQNSQVQLPLEAIHPEFATEVDAPYSLSVKTDSERARKIAEDEASEADEQAE